jgi:AcrR family transcriptional regulator
MATKRKYELKERARRQAETRRRITQAAVDLHGTVGPAHTQISEIARRARVERLTVYKHFPQPTALFQACSAHWEAQHPPPDPGAWSRIADPHLRARTALEAMYGYFDENERMLANVIRDAETVPAVREVLEGGSLTYIARVRDVIVAGWRTRARRRERLATVVELALDFHTWRLLTRDRGLGNDEAAELIVSLVACAAAKH